MADRNTRNAEPTRAILLEKAAELFTARGYADTSLMMICEAVGMTKGAVFHYFRNKSELFREVWTELQAEMDREAWKAVDDVRDSADPFAMFLAGSLTYLKWTSRKDYQRIVVIDGPAVLGRAGIYEATQDAGFRRCRMGMQHLSSQGLVSRDQIVPLSIMFQSALNGAGREIANSGNELDYPQMRAAFELMLRGIS